MIYNAAIKNHDVLNSFFSSKQINSINKLLLPPTLLFKTATAFDTKRINTKSGVWEYKFSGLDHLVKFKGTLEEVKIKKYILASFVNKNSPVGLVRFNTVLNNLFNSLYETSVFSYKNSIKFLQNPKNNTSFYFCISAIRTLCIRPLAKVINQARN